MARVALTEEGDAVVVLLTAKSDEIAFRATFRDTLGSTDPSLTNDPDLFIFPLARRADVCAVGGRVRLGGTGHGRVHRPVDPARPAAEGRP